MAREMALAGKSRGELKPSDPAPSPQTPRKKWENLWYHYKWVMLGGALLLVTLFVVITEIATKNPPDYQLLFVTEKAYPANMVSALEEWLESYGTDVDGDGTVEVQIATCQLGRKATITEELGNYQTLQSHLASGDVMFFAFEKEYYEWFVSTMEDKEYDFLTPLDFEAEGLNESRNSWTWEGDSRITQDPILSYFPENMVFGVRVASGTAAKKGAEQQQALQLLEAVAKQQKREE